MYNFLISCLVAVEIFSSAHTSFIQVQVLRPVIVFGPEYKIFKYFAGSLLDDN